MNIINNNNLKYNFNININECNEMYINNLNVNNLNVNIFNNKMFSNNLKDLNILIKKLININNNLLINDYIKNDKVNMIEKDLKFFEDDYNNKINKLLNDIKEIDYNNINIYEYEFDNEMSIIILLN